MPDDDGEGSLDETFRRVDATLQREMDRMQREVERIFADQDRTIARVFGNLPSIPGSREIRGVVRNSTVRPARPPRPPTEPRAPTHPQSSISRAPVPPTPEPSEPMVTKSLWEHLEEDPEVATAESDTKPAGPLRSFWAKFLDIL